MAHMDVLGCEDYVGTLVSWQLPLVSTRCSQGFRVYRVQGGLLPQEWLTTLCPTKVQLEGAHGRLPQVHAPLTKEYTSNMEPDTIICTGSFRGFHVRPGNV